MQVSLQKAEKTRWIPLSTNSLGEQLAAVTLPDLGIATPAQSWSADNWSNEEREGVCVWLTKSDTEKECVH